MSDSAARIDWDRYAGALFDLDGVVTDTASIHARCWKGAFDEMLRHRSEATGEAFVEFDIEDDYLRYVDGKPRMDGVRSFFGARGIELPEGAAGEAPGCGSVHAVAALKNEKVGEAIDAGEVEVYEASVTLIRALRAVGKRVAVVTSSANGERVLRAVGLEDLFEERVDGVVAAREGFAGKPAPDGFLFGARLLGEKASALVVFEDAVSGVEAGRRGAFGLVVGVARHGDVELLRGAGADVVVSDLGELNLPE